MPSTAAAARGHWTVNYATLSAIDSQRAGAIEPLSHWAIEATGDATKMRIAVPCVISSPNRSSVNAGDLFDLLWASERVPLCLCAFVSVCVFEKKKKVLPGCRWLWTPQIIFSLYNFYVNLCCVFFFCSVFCLADSQTHSHPHLHTHLHTLRRTHPITDSTLALLLLGCTSGLLAAPPLTVQPCRCTHTHTHRHSLTHTRTHTHLFTLASHIFTHTNSIRFAGISGLCARHWTLPLPAAANNIAQWLKISFQQVEFRLVKKV